jgi:hypothetical protein
MKRAGSEEDDVSGCNNLQVSQSRYADGYVLRMFVGILNEEAPTIQ